jgi:hypothetical protein
MALQISLSSNEIRNSQRFFTLSFGSFRTCCCSISHSLSENALNVFDNLTTSSIPLEELSSASMLLLPISAFSTSSDISSNKLISSISSVSLSFLSFLSSISSFAFSFSSSSDTRPVDENCSSVLMDSVAYPIYLFSTVITNERLKDVSYIILPFVTNLFSVLISKTLEKEVFFICLIYFSYMFLLA